MERRRAIRVPLNTILDIYKEGEPQQEAYRGCGINISLKGVAIETTCKFEKKDNVVLKINLPIEIKGKVAWVKQDGQLYRCGIAFSKIGLIDKIEVSKLSNQNFPKSS